MTAIAHNYQLVTEAVGQAAERSGRSPEDIKIVCAAKTKRAESVRTAIVAGAKHIGENYVQEAVRKIPTMNDTVTWHLIGHLQRNKAKTAVQLFDLIHSLDRLSLAIELDRHGKAQGKIVHVLIQVNIASEQSRTGILPEEIEKFLDVINQFPDGECDNAPKGALFVAGFGKHMASEFRKYIQNNRDMLTDEDEQQNVMATVAR